MKRRTIWRQLSKYVDTAKYVDLRFLALENQRTSKSWQKFGSCVMKRVIQ
jgi:hypothetical protein